MYPAGVRGHGAKRKRMDGVRFLLFLFSSFSFLTTAITFLAFWTRPGHRFSPVLLLHSGYAFDRRCLPFSPPVWYKRALIFIAQRGGLAFPLLFDFHRSLLLYVAPALGLSAMAEKHIFLFCFNLFWEPTEIRTPALHTLIVFEVSHYE